MWPAPTLDAARVADSVSEAAQADEQFRPDLFGARVLRVVVIGAVTAARRDESFAREMDLAIGQVLLERSRAAGDALQRIEAALHAESARLHLVSRHHLKAPPRELRELLMAELRATDLVGRKQELAGLQLWLGLRPAWRDIGVHCVTGPAGGGKTRLAIELCEWAEAQGWAAGFVRQEELERFHAQHPPSAWRWDRPTLVVVDYAAASVRVLRNWLNELARDVPEPDRPPLRALLLERHAAADAGWWADLRQPSGVSGHGPDALVEAAAPLRLGPLRAVAHRRALLAAAMRIAGPLLGKPPAPLPEPGADALFDSRLADDAIETQPLFLLMAGVVAVERDAPTALAMGRLDLADRLAGAERERLGRRARAIGADDALVPYLAACVTVQGGCGAEHAAALVEAERAAFGDRSATRTGALVALLSDALVPRDGDGVDAVRPDLIGEAFLLQEFARERRSLDEQAAIVERAFVRAGQPVVATVIRTAQDHADGDADHRSVAWLDRLAGLTDDPFALMEIARELPAQTLALRERAAEIQGKIASGLAERSVRDDVELRPMLAAARNDEAIRLSAVGDREAALSAAREAADLYRALSAQRPDAFRPDLALSLNNLAAMLSGVGDREAALSAAREAADLYRALSAQRPDAFRPDLALSLNNLATMLSDVGDREAAL